MNTRVDASLRMDIVFRQNIYQNIATTLPIHEKTAVRWNDGAETESKNSHWSDELGKGEEHHTPWPRAHQKHIIHIPLIVST